jgi:hypothetical protein
VLDCSTLTLTGRRVGERRSRAVSVGRAARLLFASALSSSPRLGRPWLRRGQPGAGAGAGATLVWLLTGVGGNRRLAGGPGRPVGPQRSVRPPGSGLGSLYGIGLWLSAGEDVCRERQNQATGRTTWLPSRCRPPTRAAGRTESAGRAAKMRAETTGSHECGNPGSSTVRRRSWGSHTRDRTAVPSAPSQTRTCC